MSSVAQPNSGAISNTKEALEWAWAQGEFNSLGEQAVLAYLCTNAFINDENPEDAVKGQVMYGKSSFPRISESTGIASKATIRKHVNSLQLKGYLFRKGRTDAKQPNRILLLWGDVYDEGRADLRAGGEQPEILNRLVQRHGRKPVPGDLRLVK